MVLVRLWRSGEGVVTLVTAYQGYPGVFIEGMACRDLVRCGC